MVENIPARAIYSRCSDNWITDNGWYVGLRIPAIESAMRIMKVDEDEQLILLDEVQLISRTVAKEIAKERERNQEENKE